MFHVYDKKAFGSRASVVCQMQYSLKLNVTSVWHNKHPGTIHRLENGCMLTATLTCFLSRLASLLLACLTVLELSELAVWIVFSRANLCLFRNAETC